MRDYVRRRAAYWWTPCNRALLYKIGMVYALLWLLIYPMHMVKNAWLGDPFDNDFTFFVRIGDYLRSGGDPLLVYTDHFTKEILKYKPEWNVQYPPPALLWFWGFSLLRPYPELLWALLSVAVYFFSAWRHATDRRHIIPVALCSGVATVVGYGHAACLLVAILMSAVRPRFLTGLLCAATFFKPQFFWPLLPMFLLQRRWGALLGLSIGVALQGVAVQVWLGAGLWTAYLHAVQGAAAHLLGEHLGNVRDLSLTVTLFTFGMSGAHAIMLQQLLAVGALIAACRAWHRDRCPRLSCARMLTLMCVTAPHHLYMYDVLYAGSALLLLPRTITRIAITRIEWTALAVLGLHQMADLMGALPTTRTAPLGMLLLQVPPLIALWVLFVSVVGRKTRD